MRQLFVFVLGVGLAEGGIFAERSAVYTDLGYALDFVEVFAPECRRNFVVQRVRVFGLGWTREAFLTKAIYISLFLESLRFQREWPKLTQFFQKSNF